MRFLPTQPETLLPVLRDAFEMAGLHRPESVELVHAPTSIGRYRVTDWAGAPSLVTLLLHDLTGAGLAGTLEGLVTGPARPERVHVLPRVLLGCDGMVHPWIEGESLASGAPSTALTAMGRVLDQLVGTSGTGLRPGLWRPWPEVWSGLVQRWAALARRGQCAPEPMVSVLLREAQDLPEGVAEPVWVPGELSPATVRHDASGDLVAVDAWCPCWAGDRWSAWGPVLHLSGTALATIRAAHGSPPDLVAATSTLQAVAAGHALQTLAGAAALRARPRTDALERAHLLFEARTTLPERLRGAMAAQGGASEQVPAVGVPRRRVLAVLDRAVREPALMDASRWAAVAGTVLVAHSVRGVREMDGWNTVADRALDLLEAGLAPAVCGASEATPDPILGWLADLLRDACGGHAPADLLAQLGRAGPMLPPKADTAEHTQQDRLVHALLRLAVAEHAAEPGSVEQAARALEAAWSEAAPTSEPPHVDAHDVLAAFSDPSRHDSRHPVGLVLLALRDTRRLPASPAAILHRLGLQIRAG